MSNTQYIKLQGNDFHATLTRAVFEELNMDLFQSLIKPVEKFLKDANKTKEAFAEIVLVGASTRIPKVQQIVREFFNGRVCVLLIEFNVEIHKYSVMCVQI